MAKHPSSISDYKVVQVGIQGRPSRKAIPLKIGSMSKRSVPEDKQLRKGQRMSIVVGMHDIWSRNLVSVNGSFVPTPVNGRSVAQSVFSLGIATA